MIKVLIRAFPAVFLVWISALLAQEGMPKEPFKVFDRKSKEPVEITSERLSADLSQNKITFSGNVIVRQGIRVIYADSLDALYEEGGDLKSIFATGNVKMTAKDSFATGEKLNWDNEKQTVRLWGNPRLIQGRQIIIGDEMLFFVKEDRLTVSRPQIEWLPEKEGSGKKGRDGRKK